MPPATGSVERLRGVEVRQLDRGDEVGERDRGVLPGGPAPDAVPLELARPPVAFRDLLGLRPLTLACGHCMSSLRSDVL